MDSSTKYGFSFYLAIFFHLLLIALVIIGLSFEPESNDKKPVAAMQATVLDASQLQNQEQKHENNVLESGKTTKKAARLERKRLAQAKKQALRLEQAEKQKLLTAAAQELLSVAMQSKKLEQQHALEVAANKKATEIAAQAQKSAAREKWLKKIAEQKKTAKKLAESEKIKQEKQEALRIAAAEKKKIAEIAAQEEKAAAREKWLKKATEQKKAAEKLAESEKIKQEKQAQEQQALQVAEAEQKKEKLALEKAQESQVRALEKQRSEEKQAAQQQTQMEKLKAKAAQESKWREQFRERLQAAIERKIKNSWNRPEGTEELVAVIRVKLSANGRVKKASVEQTSGNNFFDESAINAVYKAEPFEMPDDKELLQEVLEGFPVKFSDE